MEEKTQLDRANEALMELKTNISASDRQEALKLGFSEATVNMYLINRGTNLDTTMTLLQFFKKRIEDREKLIA